MEIDFIRKNLHLVLSDDLLKKSFKVKKRLSYTHGHCYVVSEALYHLFDGWKPHHVTHEGVSHWYLAKGSEILDLTADQFQSLPEYEKGKGKGFLTKSPSKRARVLMERLRGIKEC